jgi:hypothetical protein
MSRGALIRLAAIVTTLAFLAGCAGGYQTSTRNGHEKVYKVGEDGTKNLVYEVSPEGELTVHDETDARAQQAMEAQRKVEQSQLADAERVERIEAAPKRPADDPIRVLLHDLELSPDLAKAQHEEGAAARQYETEFQGDGLIRLVDPSAAHGRELTQAFRMLSGQSTQAAPVADVEVVSRAYLEEKVGINKSTKKVGTYVAVVFEATIKSNYLPAEYTVKEEGNVFQNVQVTERFAEQIKAVIKQKIGPTIPADRSL